MDKTFKVGDKIVEDGQVNVIISIKNEQRGGETVKIAYYRPFYKDGVDKTLVGSIPLKNIEKVNIRIPSTKDIIKKIESALKTNSLSDITDIEVLKDKFKENNIIKMAEIAKALYEEKKFKDGILPLSKRTLLEKTIRSLTEEFAYALGKDLEEAEKKVKSVLKS